MVGMTPLLCARKLSIGHHGRVILADIDLSLVPGQILCLLGPNGAGKTTLFRSLMGLLPPIGGAVELAGTPLQSLSRRAIARQIAYVPQALSTPFAFTALDLVLMGAAADLPALAAPGKAEHERAHAALAQLGIGDLAGAAVTQLSGGQRQMILIARALAQATPAIVMDEPTASLDIANRGRVDQAIRRLADQGIGIILSTHDPDQAAAIGHRALLLGQGQVLASGDVGAVLNAQSLSRLYDIPIRQERLRDGSLHFRA